MKWLDKVCIAHIVPEAQHSSSRYTQSFIRPSNDWGGTERLYFGGEWYNMKLKKAIRGKLFFVLDVFSTNTTMLLLFSFLQLKQKKKEKFFNSKFQAWVRS